MKRSEMIKKVEEIILNTVGVDPDTGAVYFPNLEGYLGSRVLDFIEDLGMMPPLVEYSSPELDDSYHWEPEDEA